MAGIALETNTASVVPTSAIGGYAENLRPSPPAARKRQYVKPAIFRHQKVVVVMFPCSKISSSPAALLDPSMTRCIVFASRIWDSPFHIAIQERSGPFHLPS